MKINRAYDVPYLAGSSKRTGETYIDRRIPKTLTVKGKTFDPAKFLAIHEQTEHPLMMKGMAYETAHREALKAERKAVEADGIKWSDYQEQMGHMAAKTQREKIRTAPPDLYTKPYPHTEARLLQKDAAHKAAGGGVTLEPVDGDPFADQAPAPAQAAPKVTLEPVDHDPFAPQTSAASTQSAPAVQPAPSWSEVPGLAAQNFVPTAAHAVVQGVEGIPNMVKGVGSALGDALNPMNLVNSWTPEGQQAIAAKGAQEAATLKGAAQGAYNKYGTSENLRRTLAYDPGGALLDASTVLGGAGAVADVAKLGRVGDALGAASSVTNPVNYPGAVVRGVGKAMGNSAEPARTALSNAGVSLTPGQMLGGQFKSIEDAATSIPLLGDFVQSGRQNSIESFNRAVGNQALQPIGEAVSKSAKAGHDLINDVQSKISDRYDALKPNLIWQPDPKFLSDVNALRNGRVSTLPASQAGQFDGIIRHAMRGSFAPMNGTLFKNVESDLATTAASYASSPMAAERELGNSLNDYLTAMRGALVGSSRVDLQACKLEYSIVSPK